MTRYLLPRGADHLAVEIPDTINCDLIIPRNTAATKDPLQCIQRALAHPIGTPPLERVVRPSNRVALIIDDITRETPTALILPPILEILTDSGVAPHQITIVIALGTHRPMTPAEIEEKVGTAVARKYRIVNESACRQDAMVDLGRTSQGIPAWINRAVFEADVRIGIGMIVPHLDAGYGGGAKIILPGVCSRTTVDAFHEQMAGIETNQLGLDNAVLRLDLERFVDETVPLHFIVNAIVDSQGHLYRCVAGDAVAAHRIGIQYAHEVYGAPVHRRYPLVIADAHPHHIDLWQSTKAFAAGELLTEAGGRLILVADCPEGQGQHPRFADYIGMDMDELREHFRRGDVVDRCAAAEAMAVCRMKRRFRIGMVTNGLPPRVLQRMGFDYYPTVKSAIDQASRSIGENPIALLAHGGAILPLLPNDLT